MSADANVRIVLEYTLSGERIRTAVEVPAHMEDAAHSFLDRLRGDPTYVDVEHALRVAYEKCSRGARLEIYVGPTGVTVCWREGTWGQARSAVGPTLTDALKAMLASEYVTEEGVEDVYDLSGAVVI
jgi:hypothetical protein